MVFLGIGVRPELDIRLGLSSIILFAPVEKLTMLEPRCISIVLSACSEI